MQEVTRRAAGTNLKALVYSMLIAASVNNAYYQIVVSRVMYAGTVVMAGDVGREINGSELLLTSIAATRFFLISAFVLCVVLLVIVNSAFAQLRATRFSSPAWIVPGGSALGALVGLTLAQMNFPISIGSITGMVLAGMSAGGFLALYLASKLRAWKSLV